MQGGGGLPFEKRRGECLELEVGIELRHVGVRVIVRRAPVQIEAEVPLLKQDAADVGHLMRGAIIRNQAGN
jgi:hypothetical protein